mmetsp:Transcript_1558/g.4738  ORF Transcript_1558/g.4738 Transcript_1558/m.4738 type:complete len:309 (-) Transcript_1558:404-1330(-)
MRTSGAWGESRPTDNASRRHPRPSLLDVLILALDRQQVGNHGAPLPRRGHRVSVPHDSNLRLHHGKTRRPQSRAARKEQSVEDGANQRHLLPRHLHERQGSPVLDRRDLHCLPLAHAASRLFLGHRCARRAGAQPAHRDLPRHDRLLCVSVRLRRLELQHTRILLGMHLPVYHRHRDGLRQARHRDHGPLHLGTRVLPKRHRRRNLPICLTPHRRVRRHHPTPRRHDAAPLAREPRRLRVHDRQHRATQRLRSRPHPHLLRPWHWHFLRRLGDAFRHIRHSVHRARSCLQTRYGPCQHDRLVISRSPP